MLKRELDHKIIIAAIAAMLAFVLVGFLGHKSYRQKQVNEIVSRRAWKENRESGVPLSMEAGPDATPEERKQARILATEEMQWQGKSQVEVDPNATPAPVVTPIPTASPLPTVAPVPMATLEPTATPEISATPIPVATPAPSTTPSSSAPQISSTRP